MHYVIWQKTPLLAKLTTKLWAHHHQHHAAAPYGGVWRARGKKNQQIYNTKGDK